jgi:uncharacterized protein (UPF0216 family)
MDYEKILDTFYKKNVSRMNIGLPKIRRKLSNLIEMDDPHFETISGGKNNFSKEELEKIFKKLPQHISFRLMLPLVFMRNYKLGEGVFSLEGKIEAEAFSRLLDLGYELPKAADGRYFTYKPLIFEFTNRYKTLATIGFF